MCQFCFCRRMKTSKQQADEKYRQKMKEDEVYKARRREAAKKYRAKKRQGMTDRERRSIRKMGRERQALYMERKRLPVPTLHSPEAVIDASQTSQLTSLLTPSLGSLSAQRREGEKLRQQNEVLKAKLQSLEIRNRRLLRKVDAQRKSISRKVCTT
jgi:hypothetical protein